MIPANLKRRLAVICAITKKDLKIAFRFPKNFIAMRLIEPLRLFIFLGLVYKSFFVLTDNQAIGNWNRGNYVPTLLIGAIFYSGFNYTYGRFRSSFLNDKYWKTIQIFLTSPISKVDFLIGSTLALIVELLIPVLSYMAVLHILYHIPIPYLLTALVSLYVMLFGVLGFSLLQGAFAISNENYLFIFDYFFAGWALFSCFYYSDSALPMGLQFLTRVNPIYHAVEIARASILHHLSSAQILNSALFLLCFSILAPFIGAAFFRRVVREMGVRGF